MMVNLGPYLLLNLLKIPFVKHCVKISVNSEIWESLPLRYIYLMVVSLIILKVLLFKRVYLMVLLDFRVLKGYLLLTIVDICNNIFYKFNFGNLSENSEI